MDNTSEKFFKMVLGKKSAPVQYKVMVFRPQPVKPIPRLTPSNIPDREVFRQLLRELTANDIAREPNRTLVYEGSKRIDSQGATAVWRNIHYQEGRFSFAAVTVGKGADVCYDFGHQRNLLGYIHSGLVQSFDSFPQRMIYNIQVTVQVRLKREMEWSDKTNIKHKGGIFIDGGGPVDEPDALNAEEDSECTPAFEVQQAGDTEEWGIWRDADPTTAVENIQSDLVDGEEDSWRKI